MKGSLEPWHEEGHPCWKMEHMKHTGSGEGVLWQPRGQVEFLETMEEIFNLRK